MKDQYAAFSDQFQHLSVMCGWVFLEIVFSQLVLPCCSRNCVNMISARALSTERPKYLSSAPFSLLDRNYHLGQPQFSIFQYSV